MSPLPFFGRVARACRERIATTAGLRPNDCVFTCVIPVRTQSESNMRENWRAKASRAQTQREATALVLKGLWASVAIVKTWPGWNVTLTRIARAELDEGDNLNGSMKAIRDQLTEQLGIGKWSVPRKAHVKSRFLPDDRDPRLKFEYAQDAARSNEYAVLIEIHRAGAA